MGFENFKTMNLGLCQPSFLSAPYGLRWTFQEDGKVFFIEVHYFWTPVSSETMKVSVISVFF
jgi:hypothetical protein